MSGHFDGSEQGRKLCDALWKELALLRPGVSRSESANWCALFHPPQSRIAYIKHRKGFLRVYFRSNPDTSVALMPSSLQLHQRGKTQSAWAKRFAFSFEISDPERVHQAARFLSELSYPLATGENDYAGIASELSLQEAKAQEHGDFSPETLTDARRRVLRAIVLRRGQPTFRDSLILAYNGRCAITDCDAISALEAAHIIPYCGIHSNHVSNGLLLRADIHTLFDLNLIAIHPKRLEISIAPTLATTSYSSLAGCRMSTPVNEEFRPSQSALVSRWHQLMQAE